MYDNDYTTDRTSSKFVARIARIACNSMRTLTEDMLHSTRQTLLKKHVHQQSMCTLHAHLSSLLVCAACHDVYERTPFLGTIAMHKRCHVLSFFSAVISLCFAMFASFINVVTTSYSTEVTYHLHCNDLPPKDGQYTYHQTKSSIWFCFSRAMAAR